MWLAKHVRMRGASGGRRWTQGDLAAAVGVARQTVSSWVTGKSVPDNDMIVKLTHVLGDAPAGGAGDAPMPSPAHVSPLSFSEEAAVLAEQVGRVIAEAIRQDEAEHTRDGRLAVAEALEEFAERMLQLRDSAAVGQVFVLAKRLRRGMPLT